MQEREKLMKVRAQMNPVTDEIAIQNIDKQVVEINNKIDLILNKIKVSDTGTNKSNNTTNQDSQVVEYRQNILKMESENCK
jgi:hypothetical protein